MPEFQILRYYFTDGIFQSLFYLRKRAVKSQEWEIESEMR